MCIDDEIPFEIPESWEWVRFEAALINRDAERIPVSVADRNHRNKIYDYYGASGVIDAIDDYLFDKPLLLIGEDGANLLNRSTPIAFMARGKYWVNNHAHVLDGISEQYLEYIALFINSISLAPYVTGTAQPKMNQQRMGMILLAIPPEREQERILARIAELDPLVSKYGVLEESRTRLDAEQPERLRKSILQMAVEGKLVEQDPGDEPASALLERIRAERVKLIKEKKIKTPKGGESIIYRASDGGYYEKRGKGEPQVIEVPFDIPDSWEWARLSDFGTFSSGKTPAKHDATLYGGPYLWVTSKDMKRFEIDSTGITLTDKGASDLQVYQPGTMLFVVRSGILKRFLPIAILAKQSTVNQDIKAFSLHEPLIAKELAYFIKAFEPYILEQMTKAVTTVDSLKFDEFQQMLIPVPPLSEWRRIVEALDLALGTVITNQ